MLPGANHLFIRDVLTNAYRGGDDKSGGDSSWSTLKFDKN